MEPQLISAAICLLAGWVAGSVGGLLGLGGGTVLVPVLYALFLWQQMPPQLCMHLAVATSIIATIFTALSSTWQHHRHGTVLWRLLPALIPGILIGGLLGGQVAELLSAVVLRRMFGCYLLLVALRMCYDRIRSHRGRLPGRIGCTVSGITIGTLSTLMGIAGGIMMIPFLLYGGIQMRRAISTSAATGIPIAVAGTIGMILAGWQHPGLPPGSLGYVHWPTAAWLIPTCIIGALFGARWTQRTSVPRLRRIFAVFLGIIGIRMLY